jgi:hypothetical protein
LYKRKVRCSTEQEIQQKFKEDQPCAVTPQQQQQQTIKKKKEPPNVRSLAAFGGDEIEGKLMQALSLLGSCGCAERCIRSTGPCGPTTCDDTWGIPVIGKTEDEKCQKKTWDRKKVGCFILPRNEMSSRNREQMSG